jgi:hypothetical protein
LSDPLAYYREHYAELSLAELRRRDRNLYGRLRRDGLLTEITKAARASRSPAAPPDTD